MNPSKLQATRDVRVFYVGKKRPKIDRTFKTGLTFMPGQSHVLNDALANQMLRHPDVYVMEGSDALKAWIEANPLDAAKQGLRTLSADEAATLEAQQAEKLAQQAAKAQDDDGMYIKPNEQGGESDTLEVDVHFGEVAVELNAKPNKGAIQEWCTEQGLTVTLEGDRNAYETQALDAYKAQYPKGR